MLMDDLLKPLYDTKRIKPRTKTTYINAITKMCRLFDTDIEELLSNPSVYSSKIRGLTSLNTQKTYFTAILAVMSYNTMKQTDKALYNEWYAPFAEVKRELLKQVISHEPTSRQKKAHINWQDIIRTRDESLHAGTLVYGSTYHLLIAMYTMIPPRRQWDYMRVKMYTRPSDKPTMDHNHIHLGSVKGAYMFLSDYKTAHVLKNYFTSLPQELVEVIKASLKNKPREYLFMKTNGRPYSALESFTFFSNSVIKRVFKNPHMSVNTLRHSYDTYIQDTKPNMTAAERMQVARDMGHSVMQSILYRLKIDEKDIAEVKQQKTDCYVKRPNGNLKKVNCIVIDNKSKGTTTDLQIAKSKKKEAIKTVIEKIKSSRTAR